MRKSALAMMVMVFCFVLTGCSREFQKKDEEVIISKTAEESCAEQQSEVMAEVMAEVMTEEISEEIQTESNEDEKFINLIGREDYESAESWCVETVENMIPIVPEGYEGTCVNYKLPYTEKDGVETGKIYYAAFVDLQSEYIDYDKYYLISDVIDIEGEEKKSGFFLCEREVLNFLEHKKGEDILERFYLDINIPETYYMQVMARNDQKVLIWNGGSYLFTYNFESEKCSLITDSALDFKNPVEGELYFTDWDHTEYVCNWSESNEVVKTGKEVVTYFYECDLNPVEDEVMQKNFSAIQKALKNGNIDREYLESKGYEIYNDYLYDLRNEKGLSVNIHLPYASDETGYAVYGEFMSCWEIDRNQLYLYRYGDCVRQYVLDEGNWCIIDSTLGVTKKLFNGDADDQVSAEELNRQIATVDVLLLNTSEKCLYHLSDIEGNTDLTLVAENVVDCYAYEDSGIAYWLDDNNCAYEIFWVINEDSILIGENAIGIAKVKGEQAGFIVKPGDTRCNATRNGVMLCTMYGDDWLNQDQTSGAWALEYDWD